MHSAQSDNIKTKLKAWFWYL